MTDFAGEWGTDALLGFNGRPQPGELVGVYLRGTLTKATLYRDRTKSVEVDNPAIADARGNVVIVTDPGNYDVVTAYATFPISVGMDPVELVDALTSSADSVAAETARAEAAEALLIPLSQKGAADGVATLGSDSKVPSAQLPAIAITDVFTVGSEAEMLALAAERGDVAIRTDLTPRRSFILSTDSPATLGDWIELDISGGVTSVAGRVGDISLAEADVADLVDDLAAKVPDAGLRAGSPLSNVYRMIHRGVEDINLGILSDSTGYKPTDWPYLMGLALGAMFPTHTVRYSLWDATALVYGNQYAVTNKALTSNVATLATSAAHGLAVGDPVVVENVDSVFNGQWTVASTPTTTTFTYAKTHADVASTGASGTASRAAFQTLSAGSGPRFINIWNGGASGYDCRRYLTASKQALSFGAYYGFPPVDALWISTSHNESSGSNVLTFRGLLMALFEAALIRNPWAGLIAVAQNPETVDAPPIAAVPTSAQAERSRVVADVAGWFGAAVANVYDAFADLGDFSAYMLDTVHPNALGESTLWLPVIMRGWTEAASAPPADVPEAKSALTENLIQLPTFPRLAGHKGATWPTMPEGWEDGGGNGVTISKDTTHYESGNFALRLQDAGGGGTSSIYYDLTQAANGMGLPIEQLRGRVVTFGIRIYVPQSGGPAGQGSPNFGISGIYDNVLGLRRCLGGNTGTPGDGYGAFRWQIVSAYISPVATQARVYVYVNIVGGADNTGDITIDRVYACRGLGHREAVNAEVIGKLDKETWLESLSSVAFGTYLDGDNPGAYRVAVTAQGVRFGAGVATTPDMQIIRSGTKLLHVGAVAGGGGQLGIEDSLHVAGTPGATAVPFIVAGGTASGSPLTGTHAEGEVITTADGHIWVCTVAGTPGTWVDIGAAAAAAAQAYAIQRANHTGTQTMSTISDAGALATLSAVDSAHITDGTIANADLANMTAPTVKGRHTAGTGAPEDVTMAQLAADLGLAGMFQLGEVDLSGSQATIDISSIPATYQHLEIIAMLRSDRASAGSDDVVLSLNNDTTDADYDSEYAQANLTSSSAVQALAAAGARFVGRATAATAPAGSFGFMRLLIPNYSSATPNKLVQGTSALQTSRSTGGMFVRNIAEFFASAAAINRITFAPVNGTNFVSGSTVSLYGIKAGA